mmetsp:Transcript_30102/g.52896  ORF Transcript_30102/g.52896 Transcript_30102/m.52896 type:complete len:191 (+) Transcript_30102:75-647(+)
MACIPGQSFFGLTGLGPENPYSEVLVKNASLSKMEMDAFLKAFKIIDKNNNGYITVDEIRPFLAVLHGNKEPPEREVKQFIQKAGSSKRITFEQFCQIVPKIKEESKEVTDVNRAVCTNSSDMYQYLRKKHIRNAYGPRDMYSKPLTTSQEIGWRTPTNTEISKNDPRMPKSSCQETNFASEMIKSGIYF